MRTFVILACAVAALGPARATAEPQPAIRLVPAEFAELQLPAQARHKKRSKKKQRPPPEAPALPAPDLGGALPAPEPEGEPAPESTAPSGLSDVPPAAPSEPVPAAPPSKGQGGDLDFDLLGNAPPPKKTAEEQRIEGAAAVRRTVLTVHQTAGLVTLAALAATVIVGQLNFSDKFSDVPNDTGRWEEAHAILGFTTVAGFATTGLLGLFAPVPYDKPVQADTTLTHKLLMGAATLGMVAELGLGVYTASHEGLANQKSIAQAHQIIGYTTLACMGAGASAFLF